MTVVKWDDGDTFSVRPASKGKRIRARLKGYNTLESYGPVHRWGNWSQTELYAFAKQAGDVARSHPWICHTTGKPGGYGRITADCPGLRRRLLSDGLAHAFSIDQEPIPGDLLIQRESIKQSRGMWSKGAPEKIITSLHSSDEKYKKGNSYNRLCSTITGYADVEMHNDYYALCEEVCSGGSCMTYIPYKKRYGKSKVTCSKKTPNKN
jgi:endonuclease YncB( thermonuclease family)